MSYKCFLPVYSLSFHFLNNDFIFNFEGVQYASFFLLWIVFLMLYLRNLCLAQGYKDFLLFLVEAVGISIYDEPF